MFAGMLWQILIKLPIIKFYKNLLTDIYEHGPEH